MTEGIIKAMDSDYSKFQTEAPTNNDLTTLSNLASVLYLAETELAQAEEAVREAQRKVRDIAEHRIPELMDEIGVSEFTTKSGIKLKVSDQMRVSVPAARRDECWDWMTQHGYGDLVKHKVIASFGRDEEEAASGLMELLEANGCNAKDERKVEPSTLKKFIQEQLEAGREVPLDLFGAVRFRRTKITSKPESVFGE